MNQDIIQIVKAARKGQQQAQFALYKHLYGGLKSVCMRFALDDQQTSVWLNEAMMQILSNLKQLREIEKLTPWAKRIQYQIIFQSHKNSKKYQFIEHNSELIDDSNPISASPEVEQTENYEYLLSLVRKLPYTTQFVFNLYAIDGFSHSEISKELNISEGTSRWHLAEARKRLQQFITHQTPVTNHG